MIYAFYNLRVMFQFLVTLPATVRVFFCSLHDTGLEILALRRQVAVLKRKRPRPRLNPIDRLFWKTLRRVCPGGPRSWLW